ncbi:serine O-acetyltransferase [Chitinibacteraceae bacterium HSL-7]
MFSLIRGDVIRQCGGYSLWSLIRCVLFRRTFRPVFFMRLCAAFKKSKGLRIFYVPAKMAHSFSCSLAGMDFPSKMDAGAGLCITHGWGTVVNANVRLGRNVTIFHGVTLGARHSINANGERKVAFPVIEDDVWIGPNAVIVGGCHVGRGSRVAAGAFVLEDVPAYSLVMGNPARVVKSGIQPDVFNPA